MIPSKKVYATFPMTLSSWKSPGVTVDVFVEVDLGAIAWQLATKAVKTKSRRSRYLNGAVVVEARNVVDVKGSQ